MEVLFQKQEKYPLKNVLRFLAMVAASLEEWKYWSVYIGTLMQAFS